MITRLIQNIFCISESIIISYFEFQIAIRASLLGFVSSVSTLLIIFAPASWKQFGVYGFFLSFFHYSEFLAIAWSNPSTLSIDSFILNHSVHYAVAAALSWTEFVLETLLLPDFKSTYSIWILGVGLCIFGEVMRKTAMITAMANFNHLVSIHLCYHNCIVIKHKINTIPGTVCKSKRSWANYTWCICLHPASFVCRLVLVVHRHSS